MEPILLKDYQDSNVSTTRKIIEIDKYRGCFPNTLVLVDGMYALKFLKIN